MNEANIFSRRSRTTAVIRALPLAVMILLGVVRGSSAENPRTYEETIVLDQNGGAAVTVRVRPQAASPGDTLDLPYAYTAWPDSFGHSPDVSAVVTGNNGQPRRLRVVLGPAALPEEPIELAFRLPSVAPLGTAEPGEFGNYTLGYRTVNSAPSTIGRFTVTMDLPAGFVFVDVISTTPARPGNGAGTPYTLGKRNGRHSITLTDTTVAQGDVIALQVHARYGGKTPLLIVALVLLGGAYLFLFRDLVFS